MAKSVGLDGRRGALSIHERRLPRRGTAMVVKASSSHVKTRPGHAIG